MSRFAPFADRFPAVMGCAVTAFALIGAAPPPVPGGNIGVLQQGHYACETPGDATGPAGHHKPDLDFSVINASGYRIDGKRGNYLLTGDIVTMTTGSMKGARFRRMSDKTLHRIERDGQETTVRCVLTVRRMG